MIVTRRSIYPIHLTVAPTQQIEGTPFEGSVPIALFLYIGVPYPAARINYVLISASIFDESNSCKWEN